ncbi:unnamed protein product [Fusarium fujikuroi]|nr:unnamed protein product [Fusarium fujikuroi]
MSDSKYVPYCPPGFAVSENACIYCICKYCDKLVATLVDPKVIPVAMIEGDWADICRAFNFICKAILFVDKKN